MDQENQIFSNRDNAGEALDSMVSAVNLQPASTAVTPSVPPSFSRTQTNRRVLLITASIGTVLAVILIGAFGLFLSKNNSNKPNNSLGSYTATNSPLSSVNGVAQLPVTGSQTLAVNGQLQVNKSLVLAPTNAPSTPVLGEIYYNSASNTPYYYNGSSFVSFTPTPTTVGGASGAISLGSGLTVNNNQLAVSSSLLQSVTNGLTPTVSSVQGQTGSINFIAGNGITINGTTIGVNGATITSQVLGSLQAGNGISVSGGQITNTGVVALTSTGNSIKITPQGNGIFDLEASNGGSGGVVSISSNDNSIAITNDGTGNYNVQVATNGVVAGNYGSAATAATFTINGSGQVTNASSVPIAINGNQITSGKIGNTYLNTDVALYDNSTSNFTGALQQGGYNVCTTNGNCVGVPGGSIGGSGTSGAIAMFTGLGYTIGNSALTQTSGNLTDSGNLAIQGTGGLTLGTGSATVTLKAAATGTPVFTLPSSVGISGQCLTTDGSGNLSFASCLSGSGGGSGGVVSLNGMSGSLTLTQGTGLSIANGTNSVSFALANTTVTPNTYGSASSVATFTVNAQGQLSAAGNTQISLNGNQITSGTIGDAYLSSNVALYNNTTSNFTGALQQNGNNVCTTAGNCTGVAGGSVGGSGTNGVLPVFTGTGYTIGNSVLSQSNGDLTDNGYLQIAGAGGLILGTGTATTAIKSSSSSAISFTLPGSTGTSGQCLTTDGTGILSFSGCLSGSGGGSGGVVSLNGLSGALNITQGSSISITTGASSISVGLATTGVSAGTYGSASSVATYTVNAQGQITSSGSTPIAINGNQITSGTIGDAYLSSNVALYNNTTSNFTGALQQNGNNVCTTAGNCTGVAGGSVGGSGTASTIAMFTGSGYTVGNSALTQSSGNLTASGNLSIQGTGGLTLGTGTATTTILGSSTSAITFTLPSTTGSANQCLVTNGTGVLSFVTCSTGGGGSGVTTLNGLSGALSLQDSSGELTFTPSGSTINVSLQKPLSVANGGTGSGTAPTAGQLLIGQTGGTYGLGTLTQGTGLSIASASGSITVGLANTAVTAASYGDGADVASFTVNAQGQLTAASNTPIAINGNQVTAGTISNSRLNTDVALYDAVASNFTGSLQQGGNNVCTTAGNCVGVSGGGIGGSGSVGSLAMFTGSGYTIGNSALTDISGNLTDSGNLEVQGTGGITLGSGSSSTSLVSSATSALTFTLPNSTGSSGQCLTTNGTGTLSFANCLSGSSSGSGGVSSLNGLSGSLTLAQGTGLSVTNGVSSITVGLANTAVTAASYGDGADVATFTVNAQGQLTAASSTPIAINGNQITSGKVGNTYLNTDVALYDNATSNFTGSLQQAGNNVCTTAGNCTGVAGGAIGGSGTAGTVAVFTGSGYTVGNSVITQASGNLTDSGNLNVQGSGGLILGSGTSTTALLSGSTSAISFTLPATTGSANQCVVTNGTGTLSFANCLSGGSGGSGGVSSLNGLSGVVTLQDTSGVVTFTNSGQNVVITLANTGVTGSSYGSASSVATFTVSSTGQLTAAGSSPIAINGNQITSGSVAVAQGGTGITSYTQGSLLYASAASTIAQLNDVATGQCLQSGGATSAPVWGSCGGSSGITGSGTSGQVALFNGTNTLTGSSVLTQASSLITDSGTLLIQPATSSTTALEVSTASTSVFTVDTTDQATFVGTNTPIDTLPSAPNSASLTAGTNPYSVTSGNFCDNGRQDLAAANNGSGTVSLFCNTGNSGTSAFSTTASNTLTAAYQPMTITSGNLCNNGRNDLITSDYQSGNTYVGFSLFCNTGTAGAGAFSTSASINEMVGASKAWSLAIGNFCNNGRTDVLVASNTANYVFCNTGSTGAAAFTSPAIYSFTGSEYNVYTNGGLLASGNFCNNGRTDVIMAGVGVYCNNGATGSSPFANSVSVSIGGTATAVGNFCGNGLVDIAVNGSNVAYIYCNTGSTGSSAYSAATETLTTGTSPLGITYGNFCSNGRNDLAVANSGSNTASIYCNTGLTGSSSYPTTTSSTVSTGSNPYSLAGGNLCNDSKVDLASANYGSGTVTLSCSSGGGVATSMLQVTSKGGTTPTLILQGASGQSADMLDTYNSSGALLTNINSAGDVCILLSPCTTTADLQVGGPALIETLTNSTSAFQVQNSSGFNLLGVDTSGNNVFVGSTGSSALASNVYIGTSTSTSSAQAVAIGSSSDTSNAVTIEGGTGASAIQIGNGATAHGIKIGTGAAAQTVSIGSTNSSSSTTINAGTGGLTIQTQGTGTLGIGNNAVAQVLAIGNSTGATSVNIQAGTGGLTIQSQGGTLGIGNNAVAQTLTIGNATGATGVTINAGTNGLSLGNSGIANNIQVGNTTGAVAQTINIGNNATVSSTTTLTAGSLIGTSSTKVQSGSGGITLEASGAGVLVQGASNSASALQVENTSGYTALAVNTSNQTVTVGNTAATLSGPFHTTADATLTTGSGPWGETAGNLCNNSRNDFAVSDNNTTTISIYCNTGSTGSAAFSATATMTLNTAVYPASLISGNLCGNGRTDLAVANYGSNNIYIYCNTGSTGSAAFSATATMTLNTGTGTFGLTSGNLCNNGRNDLAATNNSSATSSIYCNTGSTGSAAFSATATMTLNTGTNPTSITSAAFCGNGRTDLAVANNRSNNVSIYCNTGSTGSAAFSATATMTLNTGTYPYWLASGNLCNNGRNDIAVTNNNVASISVYCNTGSTGSAAFSSSSTMTLNTGASPTGIVAASLCGNGRTDLAVSNNGSTSSAIFCNTGSTGSAALPTNPGIALTIGSSPQGILASNLCNNGRSDIATANNGSGSISLFCNLLPAGSGATATLQVNNSFANDAGLIITGTTGQTADLLDAYNSNNNTLDSINANGDLCVSLGISCSGTAGLQVNGNALFEDATNSATALQVDNSSGQQVLGVDTSNQILTVDGTNSSASLGSDLMTSDTNFSSGWSGTNWSNGASNTVHTAGSTVADVYSGFTPVAGTTYQITFTFTGGNGTDTITPQIGGVNGQAVRAASDTNETQIITATGTGSLQFTPTSNWAGTITNVNVKVLSLSNSVLNVVNSSAQTSLQIRASSSTTNTLIGLAAGQSNATGTGLVALGTDALQNTVSGSSSTAIGYQALQDNTTGSADTALGYQSLQLNIDGSNNTAIGYLALQANVTGSNNTGVGYQSLKADTTGGSNTALGVSSLGNDTSGGSNTAIGVSSLGNDTTGGSNTAIGNYSMSGNTSGSDNTAVGYGSLQGSGGWYNTGVGYDALQNNTASGNSALGYGALAANTSATGVTAVGYNALSINTTGTNNTAVGYDALQVNSTGYSNTAVGANSLAVTTANYNSAFGSNALSVDTTGQSNSAFGNGALQNNTTGNDNTATGYALSANTTGGTNTASGYGALQGNTTGNSNVALGYQAGYSSVGANANVSGSYNTFLGYNTGPGTTIQLQYASAIGSQSVVSSSNSLILGCTSGVNGCTSTTKIGINTSGYANNPLSVSSSVYSTGTIAQTGTTITGTGTTFTSSMNGGTIYYSDGTSATVTYISSTSLTSSVSKTVTAGSSYVISYGGFNVTSTGAASFQANTNSTSAFQVQNASSTSILNVDTSNQIVTINQGTTTSGWQTNSPSLPSAVWGTGSFTYAGNLYEIIGSTVYEAPISGNGSTGGWTSVSTFSGSDNDMSATVYNGYVYVFSSDALDNTSGCGGGSSKIYSAPISNSGVIGTWTLAGSGYNGYFGTLQAYNGYLYLSGLFNTQGGCGGYFASTVNSIYSIPITGGGTIGAATGNAWPANTGSAFTTIYNGYLYTFGGWGGNNSNTIISTTYAASINAGTGTLSSASSSTSLPVALFSNGASALPTYNGSVYMAGGSTNSSGNSPVATLYSASLNLATVGSWASGATLPQAVDGQGNVLYGSYLYSIGGYKGSSISSVYYTSLSGTSTLLQVQNNGTNVITASNTGNLLIHPSVDSTGVVQVQNAAGSTEFDIDTQNGRIGIGTNTPGNLLSVGALTTAAGTYQIAVSTNGTTNSGIVVQDVASQSSGYAFTLQNSSGSSLASIDYQGNLIVQNATVTGTLTVNGHIVTTNASGTTTAAVQTNAGTGATCSVTGDDTDGTITLVTGTASWASGTQCIVSFGSSFTAAPNTVISPTGSTNASSVVPTVIPSTGSFTVNFINADTAQHTYTWDYVNLH